MMRTIEVLIVVIILSGAFIASSFFAVLPGPSEVSPVNLRRLSLTTLQVLDSKNDISTAAFEIDNATIWRHLQVALSASLPPNIIYNFTVYDMNGGNSQIYTKIKSISNAENLGISSDSASYAVSSSNVTFNVIPEKIGEQEGGITLYILNCSDANSWWTTGYTAQSLSQDIYSLLSPYFAKTVMVQSTTELATILNGDPLQGETLENAVIINTYGEAVPIPTNYANLYNSNNFAEYFYELGKRVNQHNWTWTSIVGHPFYYVSNTNKFSNDTNGWGIYGMEQVGKLGLNAFLQGLDNRSIYEPDEPVINTGSINELVSLSSQVLGSSNYYGIYPSYYQTATRALPTYIIGEYNLEITTQIFDSVPNYIPSAIYRHVETMQDSTQYQGSLYALGLTRTPDIRLTALGLLSDFKPRLFNSEYTANGTSRLVVLHLGLLGGA